MVEYWAVPTAVTLVATSVGNLAASMGQKLVANLVVNSVALWAFQKVDHLVESWVAS